MNFIINATTLSGTGVTQVAVSFIQECIGFPENIYHVFLSKTVSNQIDTLKFPKNFYFYNFEAHPLYGIKGFSVRKRLRKLECLIKPDIVFTVFGPACWTPKSKHVSGFANSYYVYPESSFFNRIPLKERLKIKLMKLGHQLLLKRNGDFFICETKDMSERLCSFLEVNKKNVFTVSNTFNKYFENYKFNPNRRLLPENKKEFRLLVLASLDIHKNLEIINNIVPILKKKLPTKDVKFILTVDPQKFDGKFTNEAKSQILNFGRVPIQDCPQLYAECDALFLPSLIESFSANYPEAMKMERPILTSNYSFATSICKDAAIYFNPLDPDDISDKIIMLIEDQKLYLKMVNNGKERIKEFGSPRDRTERYLEVLQKINSNK